MRSVFSYRFDYKKRDILFSFIATNSFDQSTFFAEIDDQVRDNLIPDELIIVVRDPLFSETQKLFQDELDNIKGRLGPETAVFLVSYNSGGQQAQFDILSGAQENPALRLGDIKRRALTYIFRLRNGFVSSTENYHFQNPSKKHTKRFLRLSNILARGAEIAFMAFCVLPFVPERATIAYIDTPALFAIVAAINDQLQSFDSARPPVLVDNFSSYAGVENYPFTQQADSFVLISASSSGSLAYKLQRMAGFKSGQIFHFLYLGEDSHGINIVCDLSIDANVNPEGYPPSYGQASLEENCKLCLEGSHAIVLKGDHFEFGGPELDSLEIEKKFATTNLKDLMDELAGLEILKVGLGNSQKQPCHFFIDSKKLVASEDFKSRTKFVFKRTVPAATSHIIYINRDSEEFAKFAQEHARTAKLVARDSLHLCAGTPDPVVVIAAVIESGRVLQDISRELRSECPDAPIVYLVGLTKTLSESRHSKLKSTLTLSDKYCPQVYESILQIFLPASGNNNAWNQELNLLRSTQFTDLLIDGAEAIIGERRERLEQVSKPLLDELFLSNSHGSAPLKIQPGFAFWNKHFLEGRSQADVYFTVASVFQKLRTPADKQSEPIIKKNAFQQTLLHPNNFGRFNDGVIQASMLRCALPAELNFASSEDLSSEMARIIRRIVENWNKPRGEAACEFLLAIALGRIRLHKNSLNDVIGSVLVNAPPLLRTLMLYIDEVVKKE